MGKPTKNDTGSGGDERDERKIRAGSNPSKSSSSSTVKRLGDNEMSRAKTGVRTSARQSTAGRAVVKQPTNVTIHSPLIVKGSGQAQNRANTTTAKPTKPGSEAGVKTKSQIAKMKQETESSEHKLVDDAQESSTSTVVLKQQAKDSSHIDESAGQHKNGLNGDGAPVEKSDAESGNAKEGKQTNGGGASIEREEEFKLRLDNDELNSSQPDDIKDSSEASKDKESQSGVKTSTEESPEGSQTDTESCSVDVVESTTSELSEATESAAPSESKDGESQDINADDAVLEVARQECSVQLMDVMKDPQCAGLLKEQTDPLERCINTRSKLESKIEESENSRPETPSQHKLSDYKQIRARRSLRPGFTYKSQSINSSLLVNMSMDEGPSNRNISEHYLSLRSDSPATSTNGSTSNSGLKKANLIRRNMDVAPTEEKKQKLDGDKDPSKRDEIRRIDMPIKPATLNKWCSIM